MAIPRWRRTSAGRSGWIANSTVAEALFHAGSRPSGLDTEGIRDYLERAEATIAKRVGRSDFLTDRLDRSGRRAPGLGHLSKRQYNKRFRLAARMERKRERLVRELEKREFTLISKSRLASKLAWDEFAGDRNTACFLAYYTARCNLRSEFTIDGSSAVRSGLRPALRRCKASSDDELVGDRPRLPRPRGPGPPRRRPQGRIAGGGTPSSTGSPACSRRPGSDRHRAPDDDRAERQRLLDLERHGRG